MAKRFTDSRKWDDPWFTDLPCKYKLMWIYMLDRCDHAGVFKVNKRLIEFCIDSQIDLDEALKLFNGRVHVINGEKWFLTKFVEFQYGKLTTTSRLHVSVLERLLQEGVSSPCAEGIDTPKDKDKDKVKEKEVVGRIVSDLNAVCGTAYRDSSKKTYDLVVNRLNDGFTEDNFKAVHRIKFEEWGRDEKMAKFLRPETLYGNKFESYLNQRRNKREAPSL